MEVFKLSSKTKCISCININESCSLLSGKSCGTDSSIGYAFIESCTWYNKKITERIVTQNTVSVANKCDTRAETLGGGYDQDEYKHL